MLSFLKPHRGRVSLLTVLLLLEIGLGALQPWPFAIVIGYVLGNNAIPARLQPLVTALTHGNRFTLLLIVVTAGVVLQVVNQFVSAYGTQVQVDTGQRMVYDLRYRLFEHLQALGLHHHITTSTSDAVYRVDIDAYSIENLVMSGLFPLATSIITLVVMFSILLRLDVTVALLSLTVVPFLYLCLRYYTSTLVQREERVKEFESKLLERLYETFSAMRLVKGFAREPYESDRYAKAGEQTMHARIAITWQQSLFSVVVTTITIFGTALVLVVGGRHVMSGTMSISALMVVIGLSWVAFALRVLTRRRVLLARHRVVAGRLAVTFTALFALGALAVGYQTGRAAPYGAAAAGFVLLAAAVAILVQANRTFARLTERRRTLERELGRTVE